MATQNRVVLRAKPEESAFAGLIEQQILRCTQNDKLGVVVRRFDNIKRCAAVQRIVSLLAIACITATTFVAHAATPAVAGGNYHSVALSIDGTVRTWGDDRTGALGIGTQLRSTVPVMAINISSVSAVAAGFSRRWKFR